MLSFQDIINAGNAVDSNNDSLEFTASGIAMKAVKHDNAEADDMIWNELLFKRCSTIPYSHDKHKPLIDAI